MRIPNHIKKKQLKGFMAARQQAEQKFAIELDVMTTFIMMAAMQFLLDHEEHLRQTVFKSPDQMNDLSRLLKYFENCGDKMDWSVKGANAADQYLHGVIMFEKWHKYLFLLSSMDKSKNDAFTTEFNFLLKKHLPDFSFEIKS